MINCQTMTFIYLSQVSQSTCIKTPYVPGTDMLKTPVARSDGTENGRTPGLAVRLFKGGGLKT